jgi:hypothetical protein
VQFAILDKFFFMKLHQVFYLFGVNFCTNASDGPVFWYIPQLYERVMVFHIIHIYVLMEVNF